MSLSEKIVNYKLYPEDVKKAVKELMCSYCKGLPRKSDEFCGYCNRCNKFKEIFGEELT